jgi:hypothetical protein
MTDNQKMITNLATFVRDHHETAYGDNESLYYELLKQWRHLNRPATVWADSTSKHLYQEYWRQMGKWYQSFQGLKREIVKPDSVDSLDMQDLLEEVIKEAQQMAIEQLSQLQQPQDHGPVIALNNFVRILENELVQISKLDTLALSPADFEMLVEYWQAIARVTKQNRVEK